MSKPTVEHLAQKTDNPISNTENTNNTVNGGEQESLDFLKNENSNYNNFVAFMWNATNKINHRAERVCGGAETNNESESNKEGYHHPPTDEHGHGSLQTFERREGTLRDLYEPSMHSNRSHGITFEEWLMRKKIMFAERAAKSRQLKAAYERDLEERRLLAAEKYDEWLSEKIKKNRLSGGKLKNSIPAVHIRDYISQEEMEQRVQEWEQRKQRELEQKREERRLEAELQMQRIKWRKIQSDAAWKAWLERVEKRRKSMLESQKYSASLSDNVTALYSDSYGLQFMNESLKKIHHQSQTMRNF